MIGLLTDNGEQTADHSTGTGVRLTVVVILVLMGHQSGLKLGQKWHHPWIRLHVVLQQTLEVALVAPSCFTILNGVCLNTCVRSGRYELLYFRIFIINKLIQFSQEYTPSPKCTQWDII